MTHQPIGDTATRDLVRKAQAGDVEARNGLVESHQGLVRFVVCQTQKNNRDMRLPFDDLVQEGTLAIFEAIDAYDHAKCVKFSFYAYGWIRARIIRFLKRNNSVVRRFRNGTRDQDSSLDVKIWQDDETTIKDILPDTRPMLDDALADRDEAETISVAIQQAAWGASSSIPREIVSAIVKHRLLTHDPESMRAVGDRVHRSYEAIRKHENRILARARVILMQSGEFEQVA